MGGPSGRLKKFSSGVWRERLENGEIIVNIGGKNKTWSLGREWQFGLLRELPLESKKGKITC